MISSAPCARATALTVNARSTSITTTAPVASRSPARPARWTIFTSCRGASQLDIVPGAGCAGGAFDERRGGRVLDRVPHRLVDGQLLRRGPSLPAGQDFAELRALRRVAAGQLVAAGGRRRERRARFDCEDGGSVDRRRVDLGPVAVADRIEVGAGRQPAPLDDGFSGVGAQANDVGTADGGFRGIDRG